MSSGFSGGAPDFFAAAGGRSSNIRTSYINPQQQFSFRSPLSGILPEAGNQIRRPDFVGKRSLAEFQQQQSFLQPQQNQQGLGFYIRNVKPRPNYHHASPISPLSPVSSDISSVSNSVNSRYGMPVLQQHRLQPLTVSNRNVNNVTATVFSPNMGRNPSGTNQEQSEKMMNHRLQELEKELLGEDEDDGEAVSVVTNSEWSDTIQSLITPALKPISPSPTSSSSSCSSTSASPIPCTKQSFVDAAVAISEGRIDAAVEILTRLQQVANPRGTPEQRLTNYMISALKSRVNPSQHPPLPPEVLYNKEHTTATQMLYEISPCFNLGFVAANLAILEATSETGFKKIHVLDFDIGQGRQYMHLLHAMAAKKSENALKITTFADSISGGDEKLRIVGERLRGLANKVGIPLIFSLKNSNISSLLSREKLGIEPDEALAVNFAFKLHKLPDESVTTENLRDELLRRVRNLSPTVMTVVEQEMNANTAPLAVRVRETCEHYGALLDSLDSTVPRDDPDRVRVEESLGRRMGNSVACEGRERVERCEVFGKWRARMSMAGFQRVPVSRHVAEALRVKVNSGTRGSQGFNVNEESGGICLGWKGRTLTVASAWR